MAKSDITAREFRLRFNEVAEGKAKFDEKSSDKGKGVAGKITVKVGESVPQTRLGVAAYCGLSYQATLGRERTYREKGIQLNDLEKAKRGSSLDVEAINAD